MTVSFATIVVSIATVIVSFDIMIVSFDTIILSIGTIVVSVETTIMSIDTIIVSTLIGTLVVVGVSSGAIGAGVAHEVRVLARIRRIGQPRGVGGRGAGAERH